MEQLVFVNFATEDAADQFPSGTYIIIKEPDLLLMSKSFVDEYNKTIDPDLKLIY